MISRSVRVQSLFGILEILQTWKLKIQGWIPKLTSHAKYILYIFSFSLVLQ